ncbi:MAG TPA: 16S rRNA (cytosine(1402)-N(4))-methyltransferase RsmH [Bacteroidota bacterium]|nr:16S rRNA (cytosine(1402)-N(4))-methyltransferase RsmH [Bacteroidota bacterium]
MKRPFFHTPVLLQATISALVTSKAATYVDATVGGGGHSEAILETTSPAGKLIGIDADQDAIDFATERLKRFGPRAELYRANFREIKQIALGKEPIAGILFDLGISSYQIDEPSKGFSFRSNERLDMRMDRTQELDAFQVVNRYGEDQIADVLWKYGEEPLGKRIAREIVKRRESRRIQTTGELATLVADVAGNRHLTKTLARVFQAIRIEVNNELENLRLALHDAIALLQTGGRLVVISYHSLEDRIVKETLKEAAMTSRPSGNKLIPDSPITPKVRLLTNKPIEPDETEVATNPRARSARLRSAEKV